METVKSQPFPFIETVPAEIEAGEVNITQQPNSELSLFIETVRAENQRLQIQLGNLRTEQEIYKSQPIGVLLDTKVYSQSLTKWLRYCDRKFKED